MMYQVVRIPIFEILPSIFHFHVAVFLFDDHDVCSVKYVAAVGKWVRVRRKWVGVRCLCSVRVVHEGQDWCMQIFRTSIQIFNVFLGVYVRAGKTSPYNQAVVHERVEGLTKGPARPSTTPNTPPFL